MTNEELKKKIVEVVLNSEITGIQIGAITGGYSMANNIADALIATGIGDVKEGKFEADHYWKMWQGALVELERAEHRAKFSERALHCLARSFAEAMCKHSDDTHYLVDGFIQDAYSQAEKEIAEVKNEQV